MILHSYHAPRYNGFSPRDQLGLPIFFATGNCRASGQELAASDTHIREFCNLGYATACPHLPPRRDWDAVRFSVARTSPEQVTICFVCELAHAPIEQGRLTFDLASEVWLNAHPDPHVLRLATCYLQAYRGRARFLSDSL